MTLTARDSGPSPRDFGALVHRLRTEQGLSIDEFSRRSGLTPSAVTDLEEGRSELLLDELLAVGRGLGMDVSALFRIWDTSRASN